MTSEFALHELRRARWRHARQALHLLDPGANDFGSGGLARFVEARSVRLLILPEDPEAMTIEFDKELWDWWLQDRLDPASGRSARWGLYEQPTATAAVRFERYGADGGWVSYLALHRHGGLEMEIGANGIYSWREQQRAFRLIRATGNIWAALDLYREVVEHLEIEGPWEVSLALQNTRGAILGNFGEGWAEPGMGFADEISICQDPGVLLHREVTHWPDVDGARSLAFDIGGWIEDSWGMRSRRFAALRGNLAGNFDSTKY